MPFTFNGIGTMYYGKKNLEVYEGVCEDCKITTKLTAYETRLWFTILYVPIIPIERKQIIDYCSACTHHRAIPLEDWERLKTQAVTKTPTEMKSNPDDADAAIEAHDNLVFTGNKEEAEALAGEMAQTFSKHPEVLLYLARYNLQREKDDEADAFYEKVLALVPDNQEARLALGVACIHKGRLSRARSLLSYMLQRGPHQDSAVLVSLVTALCEVQNYSEAYPFIETIARDFPDVAAKNRKFRRLVQEAENRMGRAQSILPHPAVVKRLAWTGLWAVVLLGSLLLINQALKNRSVHVVNGLRAKATISIPGMQPVVVAASNRTVMNVTEGEHEALIKVENGPTYTVKFTISDGWWDRLLKSSIFIFNVAGAAVIVWEKAQYSEYPTDNDPYNYRFYVGEPLIKIRKVDYLFQEFPRQIKLTSGSTATRTRVGMVKGDVLNLVQVLQIGLVPPQKIIPFIETHLEVLRDDESLLGTYVSLCSYYKDLERCIRFLEKGLPRRPVLVDWHRLYQQAREAIGETPKMVPQYDDFLQKEPDNSALLYLRGRLEETMKGAFYYYDKAIAADPKNPFPYFAKSFHLACKGELAAARELCGRACSLYPGTHSMKDRLYHLRFAVGEFDALEKKITLQMTKEPSNWDYFQKLVEVRVAQKNIAGAKKALNQYIETLKKQFPENSAEWAAKSQLELDYLLGDFNAMEKHLASLEDETDRNSYLITVYLNRADMEKIDAMPDIKENTNGYTALLYWLGWLDKGDSQKASQWFNRAREYFLASIDNSEKKVGQWLEKSNREIFNRLDGLFLSPEDKRVLYTAFARLYPGERGKMLARAQKMNYLPRSPYHFLAKAIKKMKRM